MGKDKTCCIFLINKIRTKIQITNTHNIRVKQTVLYSQVQWKYLAGDVTNTTNVNLKTYID